MEEILNQVLNFISANADTVVLSLATGVAAALAYVIKLMFSKLNTLATKTETELDDKIIAKVKEVLKEKIEEM